MDKLFLDKRSYNDLYLIHRFERKLIKPQYIDSWFKEATYIGIIQITPQPLTDIEVLN